MEMNQMKDKTQLDQKVELLKDENKKVLMASKAEFKQEMN